MNSQKYSVKPKRPHRNWIDFILGNDGKNIPAVVESLNDGSGMIKGQRFIAWDFEGNYFAIHNSAQNAVWCHRKNFNLLSIGTLDVKGKYPGVPCVNDYQELHGNWKDVVVLRFNSAVHSSEVAIPDVTIPRKDCDYKQLAKETHNGTALMMRDIDEAKQALLYVMEFFPGYLDGKNPCFEHIQVSIKSSVDEQFFMTADKVWDVMALMTSMYDAPKFTSRDKNEQRIRVDFVMEKLSTLSPSAMLTVDNQDLKSSVYRLCGMPKVTENFERLLGHSQSEVLSIHRRAEISQNKHRKQEQEQENPELPKISQSHSISIRR